MIDQPDQTPPSAAHLSVVGGTSATAAARLAALFPELATVSKPPWWRRRAPRAALAALVVMGVAGGGVAAAAASKSQTPRYRTATASTQDVASILTAVATIEPVSQAAVAFPVAGTVSSVGVKAGDTVSVGQQLATLDLTSLDAALNQAKAQLATAELALQQALDGETVTAGGGGLASGGAGTGSNALTNAPTSALTASGSGLATEILAITQTSAPAASTVSDSPADDAITAAQQAVLDAQHEVSLALSASATALTNSTEVCATGDIPACQAALAAVATAQTVVSDAQSALNEAATALDTLLDERATSGNVPTTTAPETPTTVPAPSPSPAAPGGGTFNGSGGAGVPSAGGTSPTTTNSPSSEQLIAYQKAVDAADAKVTVAEQAIDQATIVSPIAGTVVAVSLAVSDEVTASSATQSITIVGTGGFEVSTTVSVDDVGDISVGQVAEVKPDGTDMTLTGSVVSVGIAPTSDTSSTSYRVTVGLAPGADTDAADLKNGSTATVDMVTDEVSAALAVPTSAVATDGTRHTVRVLDGTTATSTTVDVGVVGDTWTEITRGLEAGDTIVLADLDEALPGSATETSDNNTQSNRIGGAGGGFPPGGFPAGGRVQLPSR